jgi:hypothetical protein
VAARRTNRRPGSPGVPGYALSVAVSLVVLAGVVAVVDAVQMNTWHGVPTVFAVVLLFGLIPAAVLGAPGTALVHLLTRRTAGQGWHVAAAALVGLLAGFVVFGREWTFPLLLAVATGAGRLSVVPLARTPRHRDAP